MMTTNITSQLKTISKSKTKEKKRNQSRRVTFSTDNELVFCSDASLAPESREANTSILSPYEKKMDMLDMICNQCKGVGVYVIRGLACDEGGYESGEEKKDEYVNSDGLDFKYLSTKEVDEFRAIIITKPRMKMMDKIEALVLGDRDGSDSDRVNLDVSDVTSCFDFLLQPMIKYNSDPKQKFDILLGFTHSIDKYDSWMRQDVQECEAMLEELDDMWGDLMQLSDKELGIDSIFTRPGTEAALADFHEKLLNLAT